MTFPEPHFDSNGYPTEEFLESLATLSPIGNDPYDIPQYIFDIWHWGNMMGKVETKTDYKGEEYLCFQISTGGWSGNESIIYREKPKGTYHRYDWGFLQMDMMAGKEIHIRPATKEELRFFEEKLNENLVKMGYQKGMVARVVDKDFFDFVIEDIGKPLVMR